MSLRPFFTLVSVLLSMLVVSNVAADDDDILDYLPAILAGKPLSAGSAISPSVDNAEFVDQVVPGSMAADIVYTVTIRMRNTGTTTWTQGAGYYLEPQYPPGNNHWKITQVPLPSTVGPGAVATFIFPVSINYGFYCAFGIYCGPAIDWDPKFAWRMAKAGTAFGQETVPVQIVFAAASTPPPPSSPPPATVPYLPMIFVPPPGGPPPPPPYSNFPQYYQE